MGTSASRILSRLLLAAALTPTVPDANELAARRQRDEPTAYGGVSAVDTTFMRSFRFGYMRQPYAVAAGCGMGRSGAGMSGILRVIGSSQWRLLIPRAIPQPARS
jgi:hypothetical protein